MSKKCSVCRHPKCQEIDKAITENQSLRDIAGRFNIPKSTVATHKQHITELMNQTQTAVALIKGASIQDWLMEYHKDHFLAVQAAREQFRTTKPTDEEYGRRLERYRDTASAAIAAIQRSGIVAIAAKDSELSEESNRRAIEVGELFINVVSNAKRRKH